MTDAHEPRLAAQADPQACSWVAPAVVVLVCGASGAGKSVLARQLSRRYGMPLVEVDDLITALRALTTPAQMPLVHIWDDQAAAGFSRQQILDHTAAVAEFLQPALRSVIADHLAFEAPIILEGDYLLPESAADFGDAVQAVVITEDDPARLGANFQDREPRAGDQLDRAEISGRWNTELQARATAAGALIVPSRPWHTTAARVNQALRRHT